MPICFRRILLRGDCDARIIGFMKTPKTKKAIVNDRLIKKSMAGMYQRNIALMLPQVRFAAELVLLYDAPTTALRPTTVSPRKAFT